MTKEEAVALVNTYFKYRTDIKNYWFPETWRILPKNGIGDCEDYALTVVYHANNNSIYQTVKSLWTKKYKIHYTHIPVGHAVVECDGQFADNIRKRWLSKHELENKYGYDFKFRFTVPHIILLMLVSYTIGSLTYKIKQLGKK